MCDSWGRGSLRSIDFISVWMLALSICFDILLYFNFLNSNVLGFNVSLGRIFQVLFTPFLILIALARPCIFSVSFLNMVLPYITFVFFIGVVSLVSFLAGGYDISSVSLVVRLRPFLEYFIYIYQFFFYCLFLVLIIRDLVAFRVFLRACLILFRTSVGFGLTDFILHSVFGYDLIARHFYDGVDVGSRFHGFFGEPRDAAVAITLLIFIEALSSYFNKGRFELSVRLLIFYFFLIFLTKSFSSIVGLGFSFLIFIGLYFRVVVFRYLGVTIFILVLFSIFVIFLSQMERMKIYSDGLEIMLASIVSGDFADLPEVFLGQLPNLIPASIFLGRLLNFDFLYLLFGSGLGSVAFLNSAAIDNDGGLLNPHSNIIRILIDFGLVGFFVYLYVHFRVFVGLGRFMGVSHHERFFLYAVASLIIGMTLSQRSIVLVFAFGLAIVAINILALRVKKYSDR